MKDIEQTKKNIKNILILVKEPNAAGSVFKFTEYWLNLTKEKYNVYLMLLYGKEAVRDEFVKKIPIIYNLIPYGIGKHISLIEDSSLKLYIKKMFRVTALVCSIPKFVRFITKHKIDTVVTLTIECDAMLSIVRSIPMRNRFSWISSLNNDVVYDLIKNKYWRFFLFKFIYSKVDKVVTCSQYIANQLNTILNVPYEKINVVYQWPKSDTFKKQSNQRIMREDEHLFSHKPVILTLGRLSEQKGHITLIEAFKKVVAEFKDAILLILGEGPLRKNLEYKINDLNLNNSIFLLGWRNNPISYLEKADIFVFPSWWEPSGLALSEALLLRKPTIVSRVGGLPEIIENGVNGLLVDPKDPDAITTAILNLLNNQELMKKIINNKINYDDRYSFEKTVKSFESIINEVSKRNNRVLYLTYNGLCQPLGQSQVIPYVVELSKQDYKFTVLSFEHHYEKDFEKEYQKVKAQLDNAGIGWIALKYHKYPRFFSSIYDILHGIIKAISFYIKEPYHIVHARSYVSGMMALVLKRLLRTKFIFDMRGMMADEKVDAGQWTRKSMSYKVTKWAERKMLKDADAIVVLTEKIKTYLQSFIYINAPIMVIPTCVDLNRFPMRQETHILLKTSKEDGNNSPIPSLLKRGTLLLDKDERQQMRQGLGIEDKIVIVYSGSLGTWYMFDEMVEFFKAIKSIEPKAYFLLLNKNEHDYAQRVLKGHGILPQDYMIKAVSPDMVYKYLWASDIGVFFIKPSFSKQSSSPTKLAEYLACGLPVIGNAGVGDTEEIMLENNLGSIVYKFEETEYKRAFERAMQLMKDPDFEKRAQEFVKASLSVEVGVERYKGIYEGL